MTRKTTEGPGRASQGSVNYNCEGASQGAFQPTAGRPVYPMRRPLSFQARRPFRFHPQPTRPALPGRLSPIRLYQSDGSQAAAASPVNPQGYSDAALQEPSSLHRFPRPLLPGGGHGLSERPLAPEIRRRDGAARLSGHNAMSTHKEIMDDYYGEIAAKVRIVSRGGTTPADDAEEDLPETTRPFLSRICKRRVTAPRRKGAEA